MFLAEEMIRRQRRKSNQESLNLGRANTSHVGQIYLISFSFYENYMIFGVEFVGHGHSGNSIDNGQRHTATMTLRCIGMSNTGLICV